MSIELHYKTITELADLLRTRKVSPVEVTEAMLRRIEELDPRYKSYATVMTDYAMEAAKRAEDEITRGNYKGPLHGVPIAVKDLCFTDGVRTMGGSKVMADHVPNFDATVVARLEAAGSVLLGK
ncbi:MAG: amidase, partial [Candidatus Thalassarchaeaceae archaeon]|nr:amidase [Candidatus Thalassarchaeaceae archaeon]